MSVLVAFLRMTQKVPQLLVISFSMTSVVSSTPESGFYLNHYLLLLTTLNYILKKNLLSLERVFTVYSPSVNKFAVQNEYMSILNFCLQQLQVHLHASYKLWQFLFPIKEMRDWCDIFTIISFVSALHAQMWNLRDSSAKCRLQKLTGTIVCPK